MSLRVVTYVCYAVVAVAVTGWACVLVLAEGLMGPSVEGALLQRLAPYLIGSAIFGLLGGCIWSKKRHKPWVFISMGAGPFLLFVLLVYGLIESFSFESSKWLFLPILIFILPYGGFVLGSFGYGTWLSIDSKDSK